MANNNLRTNQLPSESIVSINTIKLCAINVNSLAANKRRYDLQDFITNNDIDIALISETKLHSKHKPIFKDYSFIRTDRPNAKNGGGTAILINNKISFTTIAFPNSRNNKILEYSVIKLRAQNKNTIFIISIYATCNNKKTFIKKLTTLARDFKLSDPKTYYIIAGDLNARNITWGDHKTNERGALLKTWINENAIQFKLSFYPASEPTYPSAGSFLDYCITDSRIHITNTINNKITTIPYDSDHNAILFTIDCSLLFNGIIPATLPESRYNYKVANWKKFIKHLQTKHIDPIPFNKN